MGIYQGHGICVPYDGDLDGALRNLIEVFISYDIHLLAVQEVRWLRSDIL